MIHYIWVRTLTRENCIKLSTILRVDLTRAVGETSLIWNSFKKVRIELAYYWSLNYCSTNKLQDIFSIYISSIRLPTNWCLMKHRLWAYVLKLHQVDVRSIPYTWTGIEPASLILQNCCSTNELRSIYQFNLHD